MTRSQDTIEVESTYTGPRLEDGIVTEKFMDELLLWLKVPPSSPSPSTCSCQSRYSSPCRALANPRVGGKEVAQEVRLSDPVPGAPEQWKEDKWEGAGDELLTRATCGRFATFSSKRRQWWMFLWLPERASQYAATSMDRWKGGCWKEEDQEEDEGDAREGWDGGRGDDGICVGQ